MAVRILKNFLLFAKNNLPQKQCEEFFKEAANPKALRSISTTSRALISSDGENIKEHSDGKSSRVIRFALIGEPNCGKSTLTNRLVCNQVSVVTHVPHTTRQRTLGVYTEGTDTITMLYKILTIILNFRNFNRVFHNFYMGKQPYTVTKACTSGNLNLFSVTKCYTLPHLPVTTTWSNTMLKPMSTSCFCVNSKAKEGVN